MNTRQAALLDAAADHLRMRGLTVVIEQPTDHAIKPGIDAWVRVRKDKREIGYAVEVKHQVTPNTLGVVVARLKQLRQVTKKPLLLITNHVTPPVADRLTALDQQFVDAAGNAYLEAPGVFVLIAGRKPDRAVAAEKPGRAFTTAGLKTLFALIRDPELATAPYREIAQAAGVALGALPAVLAGLQQTGHLNVVANKRKLVATKRLLDEWALAYARTLRPKLLLRTLVAPTFENWKAWDLRADHAKWGGEPGAALLTKHLRPGVLTVYADKVPARLMVEQRLATARGNDERGLVEIRKPFWGEIINETGHAETVAPALVYADLLATGDGRNIETAQILYEERLARLFPPT